MHLQQQINSLNMPKEYEEIDFKNYIKIAIARKKSVISIFILITALTAIISLIWPKTFEAESLVKLGLVNNSKIETVEKIKDFFANTTTLENLADKLGMPKDTKPETIAKKFTLEIDKTEEGFLQIKGQGNTPEKALETLNTVIDTLIERHTKLFLEAQKLLEIQIASIKKTQQQVENDIAQAKEEISRMEEDATKYEKEVSSRSGAKTEAQGLIAESYIKLLADTKNQIDDKKYKISSLEKQLITYNNDLQQKEYEKTYETTNTTTEIEAALPKTPVSPKVAQNIILAAILGLFIGILYALTA